MNIKQTRWTFFCGYLLACLLVVLHAEERFSFEKTPGKLPKDILPRHYEIELRPDLERAVVTGREVIEIEVMKEARRVVLNAAHLQVSDARLVDGPALKMSLDETNQLLTLEAERTVQPGKHRLELSFEGKINQTAAGVFSITYPVPGGGTKKMLATQFEATDARRAFPCFDEPAFRATFALTAEVPESFEAVSNMPIVQTQPGTPGWKRVRFARTPAMPTYLLALVAGELEEVHGRAGQVETRIWFTEGKKEQAAYALENSQRLLAYYEKYFGVRFPLPKLDHIAMPGGFGGAMENWGAITYNEGTILFDPRKSSQDTKERSFGIMAHEMAHQWFGNLVTMAWWDNLWLNEGFASWMGSKSTDALNPEWHHWVRTDISKLGVMAMDAQKSTHPIQRLVTSELQIADAFDRITYTKGMFFIRMLEDYLGEKQFQKGLRAYMKRHAYSNTTTADLWAAMEKASQKPVGRFAAGWTEQPGFPLIVASSSCERGKQQIGLRQERFTLLDPNAPTLRWDVPVTAMIAGKKAIGPIVVETNPVTLRLGACGDAVKLNAGSRGYYRVAYERQMFERLRASWEKLDEADRVNFLNDAWASVETGRLSASDYLDFLPGLSSEKSLAVWEQMASTLLLMDRLLIGTAFQDDFHQRVLEYLRPAIARLGLEAKPNEDPIESVLRARLVGVAGQMDAPEVVREAQRRYEGFRQDPTTLTGDLRAAYLAIVGEHSSTAQYEELLGRAKSALNEEDRDLVLGALAQARDPQLALRTLELSLAQAFPPEASARLVSLVSGTGRHAGAAWDFMKQHHKEVMSLVEGTFQNMYLGTTVRGFSDEASAAEYLAFIQANYPPDALAKAAETADAIRYSAYLKRQIAPSVQAWAVGAAIR